MAKTRIENFRVPVLLNSVKELEARFDNGEFASVTQLEPDHIDPIVTELLHECRSGDFPSRVRENCKMVQTNFAIIEFYNGEYLQIRFNIFENETNDIHFHTHNKSFWAVKISPGGTYQQRIGRLVKAPGKELNEYTRESGQDGVNGPEILKDTALEVVLAHDYGNRYKIPSSTPHSIDCMQGFVITMTIRDAQGSGNMVIYTPTNITADYLNFNRDEITSDSRKYDLAKKVTNCFRQKPSVTAEVFEQLGHSIAEELSLEDRVSAKEETINEMKKQQPAFIQKLEEKEKEDKLALLDIDHHPQWRAHKIIDVSSILKSHDHNSTLRDISDFLYNELKTHDIGYVLSVQGLSTREFSQSKSDKEYFRSMLESYTWKKRTEFQQCFAPDMSTELQIRVIKKFGVPRS